MKGLSWPAVAIFGIGVAGFITLFALIDPAAPERGALITLVVGAVGSATTYFIGRRLDRIEHKTNTVVEQTNGSETNGHTDAPW
jgi:hypothetical protein